MTHGSFAVMDNEKNLEEIPGRKRRDWSMWNFEGESRVYTIFPFFHVSPSVKEMHTHVTRQNLLTEMLSGSLEGSWPLLVSFFWANAYLLPANNMRH